MFIQHGHNLLTVLQQQLFILTNDLIIDFLQLKLDTLNSLLDLVLILRILLQLLQKVSVVHNLAVDEFLQGGSLSFLLEVDVELGGLVHLLGG